jgi:hypothetical protein
MARGLVEFWKTDFGEKQIAFTQRWVAGGAGA